MPYSEEELRERRYGHPVHYIQCQCSTAHTFGNVTAFVQNWLINLFPENLFKTIHVNSKIAHAQLRSTSKEFLKKSCPMFIIRPRVDWNDGNVFLKGTLLTERQGDLYSTYAGTNLQPFFQDNAGKVAIKYQMNRHVMNFDVLLYFTTYMEQLNWSNYFRNAVRQEIPFNLQTCLESYLSPELLKQLSVLAKVPMVNEEGSTKDFLRYLNSNSCNPITYKIQGSSGNEEYYRYYPVNIDTIITNFDAGEGERTGQVNTRYPISFSLRCEFYSTGFYYLFSDALTKESIISVDDVSSTIIPLFTDVLTKDDIDLPLGWNLYVNVSCKLEHKDDSICIASRLSESVKKAITFHKERGITMMDFFKIRVRQQGKLLSYGNHYDFDFDTYTINFHNCNIYFTYKILIMINVDYINNLIKDVYGLQ